MLGKAIATNISAVFFSISASSLVSKWMGEGERLVSSTGRGLCCAKARGPWGLGAGQSAHSMPTQGAGAVMLWILPAAAADLTKPPASTAHGMPPGACAVCGGSPCGALGHLHR